MNHFFNPIIEINEMIDLLEDFFSKRCERPLIVGGMVGCHLQNYVLDAALKEYPLERILYVQGCQDYIDLLNKRAERKIDQYVYYADLYESIPIAPVGDYDAFTPKFKIPPAELKRNLRVDILLSYKVMIVQDAHLIPHDILNELANNFVGHLVFVVDPFDVHGEYYCTENVKTITNTFERLTYMKGFARSLYNVDSTLDKRSGGVLKQAKLSKRSSGKVDDKQYISNDPDLITEIQSKQLQSPFRKNHKMVVATDRMIRANRQNGVYAPTLTRHSLFSIASSRVSPFMRLKLFASNIEFYNEISYLKKPNDIMSILVRPANILSIQEAAYHRYVNSVFVKNDNCPLPIRQQYSVIKNSINIILVNM